MRTGAALELRLRQPGGTAQNHAETFEEEFEVERATLPGSDYDNVANRLIAAASAAIDNAFGVATEDLDWVSRYELEQLHGKRGRGGASIQFLFTRVYARSTLGFTEG